MDLNARSGHTPPDSGDITSPTVRIVRGELARLWLEEVPKVVARNEEERRQIRIRLGLLTEHA